MLAAPIRTVNADNDGSGIPGLLRQVHVCDARADVFQKVSLKGFIMNLIRTCVFATALVSGLCIEHAEAGIIFGTDVTRGSQHAGPDSVALTSCADNRAQEGCFSRPDRPR